MDSSSSLVSTVSRTKPFSTYLFSGVIGDLYFDIVLIFLEQLNLSTKQPAGAWSKIYSNTIKFESIKKIDAFYVT